MPGLVRHPLIAPAAVILAICAAISGCSADPENPPTSAAPANTSDANGSGAGQAGPWPAPVMMVIGDSFTVGSGPVPSWRAYACEAARLLGWQPVIAGAGGTGYLSRGRAGRTFQESFEAELAWRPAPDVLVISGGHNDLRWATPDVRRAAARLAATAGARWPHTRIVLMGPIWLDTPPRKAYRIRDAVAEAAREAGIGFLDPLERRWITGAHEKVLLPDGVHPTRSGHLLLARWLAGELSA